MSRPNRCIKDENGVEVWISRSSVVIPVVIKYDKNTGDFFTLLEKRGPAVTHPGEWCCPCGYIDWDETLEEACQREVREETGLEINLDDIKFFSVGTNKYSRNQVIDHWYCCLVDGSKDFSMDRVETKDEILDLKWLKIAHMDNETLTIFKKTIDAGFGTWAFKTHHTKIVEMLSNLYRNSWDINVIDE